MILHIHLMEKERSNHRLESRRRSRERRRSRSRSRDRYRSDSRSRIYIGNLSHRTTDSDLHNIFSKFGNIAKLNPRNHYAFLEYEDSKIAKEVISKMHGADIDGKRIIVEETGHRRKEQSRRDICYNCGRKGHW